MESSSVEGVNIDCDLPREKSSLFDSFEDYLDHLDSFLKFESPDKWFINSEENPCEKISLDSNSETDSAEIENSGSILKIRLDYAWTPSSDESKAENVSDASTPLQKHSISSNESKTDIVSVTSTSDSSPVVSNHDTDIFIRVDNFDQDCNRLISNKRKRRLTCEEFISHLRHTRESIFLDCKKISEEETWELSPDLNCEEKAKASKLLRKRQKVVEEILATEETYFHHLELIVDLFMEPLQNLHILPDQVLTTIFGEIQLIMTLSKELSLHLSTKSVGEAFLSLAPFLKLYSTYAQSHERALATLIEWDQRSPEFSKFRRQQEEEPEMKGLKLNALLITPVQRVPRYKLLLEGLLSCTSADHEDFEDLKDAVREIAMVANHINEHIRQQDNFMKMLAIQKSFSRSSESKILVPGRTFIKEGILKKVSSDGKKYHERIFFLFSDILIYAKPRLLDPTTSGGQYNSLNCCCTMPLHHCIVDRVLGDNRGQGSLFSIKCKNEFLLLFSDQNTVGDWISILRKQISEVKNKRQTLRKKSSALQPMRQERFLNLFKRKTTPHNTPEKGTKKKMTPNHPKSVTPVNSEKSLKSRKEPITPSRGFGTGLTCLRRSKKKFFSELPVPEKPKVFNDFTIIEETNIFVGQNNITLNDSLENILTCGATKQSEITNRLVPIILESDESPTRLQDSGTFHYLNNLPNDPPLNEQFAESSCPSSPASLKISAYFDTSNHKDLEPGSFTPSPYKNVTIRKTPGSKNKLVHIHEGILLRTQL